MIEIAISQESRRDVDAIAFTSPNHSPSNDIKVPHPVSPETMIFEPDVRRGEVIWPIDSWRYFTGLTTPETCSSPLNLIKILADVLAA